MQNTVETQEGTQINRKLVRMLLVRVFLKAWLHALLKAHSILYFPTCFQTGWQSWQIYWMMQLSASYWFSSQQYSLYFQSYQWFKELEITLPSLTTVFCKLQMQALLFYPVGMTFKPAFFISGVKSSLPYITQHSVIHSFINNPLIVQYTGK